MPQGGKGRPLVMTAAAGNRPRPGSNGSDEYKDTLERAARADAAITLAMQQSAAAAVELQQLQALG